jgi:hypothetical protein
MNKNKDIKALQHLYDEVKVPSFLHHKIIKTMKNEGLINTPRPLLQASVSGILTAVLVAIGLLAAGFMVGKKQTDTPSVVAEKSAKPQYALLVHNDDTPPADPEQQFKEYSAWVNNLKAKGFAGGEALHGKVWKVGQHAGNTWSEEATIEGNKNAISGYFLFEADNAEEAIKIAKTCPHLKYEGTLELREVFK